MKHRSSPVAQSPTTLRRGARFRRAAHLTVPVTLLPATLVSLETPATWPEKRTA
jgi:hypothetical protein